MSQISVVQYNKLNVLQQNNINNSINKQNDRQIIVLRKPQHILPQPKEYDRDDILITNTAKKKNKNGKESKSNPAPVAVARRNARERNRVKQVNNGFANLRQHIPNFIAAAFENTAGRGGNKKLSKVETLRMAVEYIRRLEEILDTDNAEGGTEYPYPSPNSLTTSPNYQVPSNITYTYQILSPPEEDDDMSSSATASPQQFIKIDTSSGSFQVMSNTVYEDGENLDPMVVDDHLLTDPSLLDPNLEFNVNSQELYLHNVVHSTDSLSPGFYSDASLSPHTLEKSDANCFIPVFNTPPDDRLDEVKPEINNELPVISLKTENELPEEQKENIVDVLQWWEHQQPQTVER